MFLTVRTKMDSEVPSIMNIVRTTTNQQHQHDKMQTYTKYSYDELNATPWTTVPVMREEGVSSRAVKQFRVSLFITARGPFIVIEEKAYNGITSRQMINKACVHSVKTLHKKKVIIATRREMFVVNYEYIFPDDECAFAFQTEVELALASY